MENKASSIAVQFDTRILNQIHLNRERLKPIVEAIILYGIQNIPLHGHRDDARSCSMPSNNPGNLLAILNFLTKYGKMMFLKIIC